MSAVARRMTPIAAPTIVLLLAVVAAGALASLRVSPIFWFTTAAVATVLLRTARAASNRRLESTLPTDADAYPSAQRRAIHEAAERITSVQARHLLEGVVRHGSLLLAAMDANGARGARHDVLALVDASCTLASELSRVQEFAAAPPPGAAARIDELKDRCATIERSLVARLTDATDAIATLHAQLLEERTDAEARVGELAAELRLEADARREVADLLR